MKLVVIFFFLISAYAKTIGFNSSTLQKDWRSGSFASQGAPKWIVKKSEIEPERGDVLWQTGSAPYMWFVHEETVFHNGAVEVDYNISAGKEDPEAGLIWRFQDKDNYYYVRANAIENNLVFYRMRDGKKELLKEAEIKSPFKSWHKIRVETSADEVKVFFDKKLVINTKEKAILKAGKIGLFTTADTMCAFDRLKTD